MSERYVCEGPREHVQIRPIQRGVRAEECMVCGAPLKPTDRDPRELR